MRIIREVLVFDAKDLHEESSFWAGVLGGEVIADGDWHSVVVDGVWRLGVQYAPDHIPPDWPNGTRQQVHLDLYVEDLREAHAHVMALGAMLLQESEDPSPAEGFTVYADPAGHPFCLCWTES